MQGMSYARLCWSVSLICVIGAFGNLQASLVARQLCRRNRFKALAEWLGVDAHWLRFGERCFRQIQSPLYWVVCLIQVRTAMT